MPAVRAHVTAGFRNFLRHSRYIRGIQMCTRARACVCVCALCVARTCCMLRARLGQRAVCSF